MGMAIGHNLTDPMVYWIKKSSLWIHWTI